jgi:serine/threonine-protein kinase SRPK3
MNAAISGKQPTTNTTQPRNFTSSPNKTQQTGGGGSCAKKGSRYEIQPSFSVAELRRDNTDSSGRNINEQTIHRGDRDSKSADSDVDDEDDDGEEEESIEDYRKGGYHPVYAGDRLKSGRYHIVRKIGWGHFSTVWLALDAAAQPSRSSAANRYAAIKIVKSARRYTEAAKDEISMFDCINRHCDRSRNDSREQPAIVKMLDNFTLCGPNGTRKFINVHTTNITYSDVCMVFEVLGENLLTVIRRFKYRGIPLKIVRRMAKQLLEGLDYLHRICGIIHTDLKPENVCLCIGSGDQGILENSRYIEEFFSLSPSAAIGATVPAGATTVNGSCSPDNNSLSKSQKKRLKERMKRAHQHPSETDNVPQTSIAGGSDRSLERTMSNISLEAPQQPNLNENDDLKRNTTGLKRAHSMESSIAAVAAGAPPSKRANSPAKLMATQDHGEDGEMAETTAIEAGENNAESADSQRYASCRVKLTDLGNACWIDHHFTEDPKYCWVLSTMKRRIYGVWRVCCLNW